MKVKELIEILQQLDPEETLFTDNATCIGIRKECGCCINPIIKLSDIEFLF